MSGVFLIKVLMIFLGRPKFFGWQNRNYNGVRKRFCAFNLCLRRISYSYLIGVCENYRDIGVAAVTKLSAIIRGVNMQPIVI